MKNDHEDVENEILKKFAQKIVKAKADGVLQESLTWIDFSLPQD